MTLHMSGFGYPEYGRLRRVLMHSPGKELDLISPRTYRKFLFENVVDRERFRRQHGNFVSLLRSEGVDVILLTEVLKQKTSLLNAIDKHPNLVFTRDTVVVTPGGYLRMRMRNPVRRREPQIAEAALRELGVQESSQVELSGTIEGGDLIFLNEETLLVGVGNRTSWQALRQLSRTTSQSGLRKLIAVRLPPTVIHLDGTMMVVDHDLAIVHPQSLTNPASVFEGGRFSKDVEVPEFLKTAGMRLIQVTGSERRNRATNVIPLGPRKAVGYAGNARVKRELSKEGVDLIEIEGSELVRGAGGPRCMTAPITRD